MDKMILVKEAIMALEILEMQEQGLHAARFRQVVPSETKI